MKKALVAIDASDVSRALIRYAFQYARKESLDQLEFIHVVEKPYFDPSGMPYSFELPKESAVEENYVKIIEDELKASDTARTPYEITVRTGTPYEEIINFAENGHYDTILIGHRGLSDLERFFIGSVAAKVVRHSPCTVLVFQPPKKE